jgi:hypothetical protein
MVEPFFVKNRMDDLVGIGVAQHSPSMRSEYTIFPDAMSTELTIPDAET